MEEPTIENSEWVVRVTERFLKQGYTYPENDPSMVHRVMAAVERALSKTETPRPPVPLPKKVIHEPAPSFHEHRTSSPAGYALAMAMMADLPASPRSEGRSLVPIEISPEGEILAHQFMAICDMQKGEAKESAMHEWQLRYRAHLISQRDTRVRDHAKLAANDGD
jgi:hypothetical protein